MGKYIENHEKNCTSRPRACRHCGQKVHSRMLQEHEAGCKGGAGGMSGAGSGAGVAGGAAGGGVDSAVTAAAAVSDEKGECKFCGESFEATLVPAHEQGCDWRQGKCGICKKTFIVRDLKRHEAHCAGPKTTVGGQGTSVIKPPVRLPEVEDTSDEDEGGAGEGGERRNGGASGSVTSAAAAKKNGPKMSGVPGSDGSGTPRPTSVAGAAGIAASDDEVDAPDDNAGCTFRYCGCPRFQVPKVAKKPVVCGYCGHGSIYHRGRTCEPFQAPPGAPPVGARHSHGTHGGPQHTQPPTPAGAPPGGGGAVGAAGAAGVNRGERRAHSGGPPPQGRPPPGPGMGSKMSKPPPRGPPPGGRPPSSSSSLSSGGQGGKGGLGAGQGSKKPSPAQTPAAARATNNNNTTVDNATRDPRQSAAQREIEKVRWCAVCCYVLQCVAVCCYVVVWQWQWRCIELTFVLPPSSPCSLPVPSLFLLFLSQRCTRISGMPRWWRSGWSRSGPPRR